MSFDYMIYGKIGDKKVIEIIAWVLILAFNMRLL